MSNLVDSEEVLNIDFGASGGVTNYNLIPGKPKINSVELIGDKSSKDLGVADLKDLVDVSEKIRRAMTVLDVMSICK